MHLTEFTTNPTTTDITRVFPKVTTEYHSLRQESSPSGLFSPLQLYTCPNTQPFLSQALEASSISVLQTTGTGMGLERGGGGVGED